MWIKINHYKDSWISNQQPVMESKTKTFRGSCSYKFLGTKKLKLIRKKRDQTWGMSRIFRFLGGDDVVTSDPDA